MRALKIIGILVAVLLVIAIALPFIVNVNSFRPKLESTLTTALGREVKVGNLGLSILSGSVSAEDLSIADDPAFSKDPFVRAKSLHVGVELIPLIFSKKLKVNELVLDQPEIRLIQTPGGKWNFSSIGGEKQPQKSDSSASMDDLSVSKLAVKDGSLSLGKTNSSKVQTYKDVDITVKNFSSKSQFPFTMTAKLPGDGDLKLDGQAGPIAQDAAETPLQADISVKGLNLATSGFVEPSSGIGGIADFTGKVTSDGHIARSSGDLTANKLKLAEKATPASKTVQLKYAIEHNLAKNTGSITQGDISIGKALAKLTGTYQIQGDVTTLNAKLNGDAMSVDELQAMLPALGVVLPSGSSLQGGTLSTNLSITGTSAKPVITGPIHLENTKLAGFNIGQKLGAISQLVGGVPGGADTVVQNLSSDVQYSPTGIQTQNINLNIPALGVVTGSGTMAPGGGALDYKMTANLSGSVTSSVTKM
ncbi:MAG TPA: AsmA family protein, partial [Terriglobales bacterium]|nr:AsmA family protein [Terriglobales bacterium]